MKLVFPPVKKARRPGVITAEKYTDLTARGLKLPPKAVVCPLTPLAASVTAQGKWTKRVLPANVYCNEGNDFCLVTNFGCGAPAAAMTVEELAVLGVEEMIFVGLAGSLQEEVQPADIVVCTESVCADGTSPHYTAKELIKADKKLTVRLCASLRARKLDFHVGRNWSTDAVFCETKQEIKHYQKNHVLTVDMETSAVLAACARRKIPCAAAYVVSDYLGGTTWQPDFKNPQISKNLRQLAAVCRALLA